MMDSQPTPIEMRGAKHPLDAPLSSLTIALRESGLYAALAFLNARTRHRYTGAYLFEPPLLRNYCLFDRENPGVRSGANLVLKESYCGIVAEHGEPFSTSDARRDSRLEGHPARKLMIAYHGFPLRDETNRCFGTLCHWDARPRLTPVEELPLLAAAASVVARQVLRELGRLSS